MKSMMTAVANKFKAGIPAIETAFYNIAKFDGTKYFKSTTNINTASMVTAFSYSTWFIMTDTGSPQSLLRASTGVADFAVVNDWTTLNAGNANLIKFAVGSTSVSKNDNSVVSTLSYQDGLLHHLACTYDGVTGFLYIDGAQVDTGPMINAQTVASCEYANRHFGGTEDFDGEQFNTVNHNRVITPAEVSILYNGGLPKPLGDYTTLLSSYDIAYPFNNGVASPLADIGGSNDAVMFNGATIDGTSVEFQI